MPELSNARIKFIRSLKEKKFRDASGLFVVEGEKMVSEACASGFEVEEIWRRDEIGENAMSRISQLSSPSPVLALVRKPVVSQEDTTLENGLYLGLDSLRDPGNMGTVIRMADWFGIDGIFASPDSVEIYNPKVIQSTMGAIFRVKFHYCDLPEIGKRILSLGGKVYGTFLDGNDIYGSELSTGADSPVMLVIGNESNGISPEVGSIVSDRLFIPRFPFDRRGSESLNAAVAASIAVAEFRRRF